MAKVLLIDAQEHMLDLLRSKFELEGFTVLTATTAEEGMALGESERPDLIVIDERMEAGDGAPLAEYLRNSATLGSVPVIVLTPRASEASEGEGQGASLQMPFRPSQLVALARENL